MNNISTIPSRLQIKLLSDTTFSQGSGTSGEVDTEIVYDELGLPCVPGTTVKRLLSDSWLSMLTRFPELSSQRVFGPGGVHDDSNTILHVGMGRVETEIRNWVAAAIGDRANAIDAHHVLSTVTTIRYQTAEDRRTGAPSRATLRSIRLAIRDLELLAPLTWLQSPTDIDLQVLSLAVLSTRQGGLARNRGPGHLYLTLDGDAERTRNYVRSLQEEVTA